jgi:hypothetical protein
MIIRMTQRQGSAFSGLRSAFKKKGVQHLSVPPAAVRIVFPDDSAIAAIEHMAPQ